MKALTTAGLTKLIDLIKSSFISVNDTVETQEIDVVEIQETDLKTINGQSIIGSGDIEVGGASSFADLTGSPYDNTNLTNALNDKADTEDIPTKTSDLTNDSGFIDDTYHDNTKQDKLTAGENIILEDAFHTDLNVESSNPSLVIQNDYSGTKSQAGIEEEILTYNSKTLELPSAEKWYSIVYGNGKFVAVAYNTNKIAYSTDGINWTQVNTPITAKWFSVAYGNGTFVAVADSSSQAIYSTDGVNWNTSDLTMSLWWQSVTYGNGKFLTIGYRSNRVAYSADGINWTVVTIPYSLDCHSVTYGNGKFVALGAGTNTAIYSTDGITWSQTTLPKTENWLSVTYGNGKFIATADFSNQAIYSTDGITWYASTLPTTGGWYSICYGNGKFVALCYGTIAYSTDGVTWSSSTSPVAQTWRSMVYGDNIFIAVGDNSNKIIYSSDAINWYSQFNGWINDQSKIVNLAEYQLSISEGSPQTNDTLTLTFTTIALGSTISAIDTTYIAGTGIDITNNIISNTQTSAEWGNIEGDIADQTDLKNALDLKQNITDNTLQTTAKTIVGAINELNSKPSGGALADLSDVDLDNPAENQILTFNGSDWENADNPSIGVDVTNTTLEFTGSVTPADLSVKLNVDADNLSTDGKKVFDGGFVTYNSTIANSVTYPASSNIEYDLSSILPDDNNNYEVLICCQINVGTTQSNYLNLLLQTDLVTENIFPCSGRTAYAGVRNTSAGSLYIPVGAGRKLKVIANSGYAGIFTIYVRGYRRIGSNT